MTLKKRGGGGGEGDNDDDDNKELLTIYGCIHLSFIWHA